MASVETPEAITSPTEQVGIVCSPVHPDWMASAEVEANVFIEKDYVESGDELAEEYQPYLPTTEFVYVRRDGIVSGSTRLIFYNPESGFKTLHDIDEGRLIIDDTGREALTGLDLTRTFEVGTLAVTPEMRARPENEGRVAVDLYAAIYAESQHHNCPNILASFDADYYDRFKGIFGPGVKPLGPAVDYMGSPTVPVLMQSEVLMQHIGENFPEMYNMMIATGETIAHT